MHPASFVMRGLTHISPTPLGGVSADDVMVWHAGEVNYATWGGADSEASFSCTTRSRRLLRDSRLAFSRISVLTRELSSSTCRSKSCIFSFWRSRYRFCAVLRRGDSLGQLLAAITL